MSIHRVHPDFLVTCGEEPDDGFQQYRTLAAAVIWHCLQDYCRPEPTKRTNQTLRSLKNFWEYDQRECREFLSTDNLWFQILGLKPLSAKDLVDIKTYSTKAIIRRIMMNRSN